MAAPVIAKKRKNIFYRVPKKCKKLTEQRDKKWILNLRPRSGGADSANANVCSKHFARGMLTG